MSTSPLGACLLRCKPFGHIVAALFLGEVSNLSDVFDVVQLALSRQLSQLMILPAVDALL